MSSHFCRSIGPADADKLSRFAVETSSDRDCPAHARSYFQAVENNLNSLDERYLMTVVETADRRRFEAFQSWKFWDEVRLVDGDTQVWHDVWVVEAWSMWVSKKENGERSYLSGHGVELLFHTFNTAMAWTLGKAALWQSLHRPLAVVAERAEFIEQDLKVWRRAVRGSGSWPDRDVGAPH